MDNTTNNNDEVTGAETMLAQANALLVELEATGVTEQEEAAAPVTGVTEDDTTSDDSASGAEAEGPVRCAYSDCDSADLASDHLEGSGDEVETDEATEEEETEGLRRRHTGEVPPPTPTWPPMPSSPLRRQVGTSLSPSLGGVEAGVLEEAMDRIHLLEAGPVEGALGDVPVPIWLFLVGLGVLIVYLTVVAYLLSWKCGVKAGP
jgi:hypothetical protein